jgi:hypothetical protein
MKKVGKYVTTNTNNVKPQKYEPGFVAPHLVSLNGRIFVKLTPEAYKDAQQDLALEDCILDPEAELYGF